MAEAQSGGKYEVVIAHSGEFSPEILSRYFSMLGFSNYLKPFNCLDDAQKHIDANGCDLLVSGLTFNDCNGNGFDEVYSRLNEIKNKGIPVLVASRYDKTKVGNDVKEHGFNFLSLPSTAEEVTEAFNQALGLTERV